VLKNVQVYQDSLRKLKQIVKKLIEPQSRGAARCSNF
jgi:hypothetical protein